jgi:Domain of unknown function (DUF5076)
MKLSSQLPVPPSAHADKHSVELLRAWVVNKGLQCSIRVGHEENEPILWGVLISDVARHAADAINKQNGLSKADILNQIREVFNDELDAPTAETSGSFTQ